MSIEKIIDRMGRTNYDKSNVLITPETQRQDIVFDGRWATWPRTLDGTRILFSCLTDTEKKTYYAYRKQGNTGSGSSNATSVTQLKKFSDLWSELSSLLTEDQVVPMFEKVWAAFPGLRIPVEVLKSVYTDKDFTICEVLGVTALTKEQAMKL